MDQEKRFYVLLGFGIPLKKGNKMDLNYYPRCSIYLNGKYYYLSYYLPNGKRILKSLSTSKRMLAKKKMHLKEQELYEGIFDDHDILKMTENRVSPPSSVGIKPWC